MKKLTLVGLGCLFVTGSFAQNIGGFLQPKSPQLANCVSEDDRSSRTKFATFGFDLGVNRSNLKFGEEQTEGDQITNGMGYRLGVLANLQFTKRFAFVPKAELSFNAGRVEQSSTSFNVNTNALEFIGHFKYNFMKQGFSPYLMAGPNLRVPLGQSDGDYVPTKNDVALDFGVGLEMPLRSFSIAPELRYSYGLTNITTSESFSDLNYHNIALVLVFRGK